MPRLLGVDIPGNKTLPYALRYIYGIGPKIANDVVEAAKIGFDDNFIYDELNLELSKRKIPLKQINQSEAIKAFKEWEIKPDKIKY